MKKYDPSKNSESTGYAIGNGNKKKAAQPGQPGI
jgi:hypothetical protein